MLSNLYFNFNYKPLIIDLFERYAEDDYSC